jgi:trk system potassium uptake protein TrkH
MLLIIGAYSSSTGGGIKVIRVIILFKLIRRGIFMRLHPNAIIPIKIKDRTLSPEMISGVVSFLSLYAFSFIISLLILSLENLDFLTTVTTVASILNNVGTGMGLVGPTGSFAVFSSFSKLYLSFLMLLGRLELFTILLIFTPSFWNPDR